MREDIATLSIGGSHIEKAKIFTNGDSQAVRLPKNCRFEDDEVLVNRIGNIVFLILDNDPWQSLLLGQSLFTNDCFAESIPQLPEETRNGLRPEDWVE